MQAIYEHWKGITNYPNYEVSNLGNVRHTKTKRKGRGLLGDNPNAKKVINTATGEIFGSIKEVCIKEGCNYSTMKAWLQGVNKNKTNYQYL